MPKRRSRKRVYTIHILSGSPSATLSPRGCVEATSRQQAKNLAAAEFDVSRDKIGLVLGCKNTAHRHETKREESSGRWPDKTWCPNCGEPSHYGAC